MNNLPPVVYERSAMFLYLSSKLEKDLQRQAAEQSSGNGMDGISNRMSSLMS